jgi:hypothetical protein
VAKKRKSEEDLFDSEDSESGSESTDHLDRVMSLMEDSNTEFIVKKVANGKALTLENGIIFRFNHDNELTAIDK